MTRHPITLPAKNQRAYALLQVLVIGPGTFFQICERAGFDYDGKRDERGLREIFEGMIRAGWITGKGIIFAITPRAKAAMVGSPEKYVGQVAGPAYRGTPMVIPARVVRREGARP